MARSSPARLASGSAGHLLPTMWLHHSPDGHYQPRLYLLPPSASALDLLNATWRLPRPPQAVDYPIQVPKATRLGQATRAIARSTNTAPARPGAHPRLPRSSSPVASVEARLQPIAPRGQRHRSSSRLGRRSATSAHQATTSPNFFACLKPLGQCPP